MYHSQCIVSALQALVGGALLACIALSDGCQMHDLQPSSRARRMYRRLSLSSIHCITLLPLSGGILIARSLSIFDLNLATDAGVVPSVAAYQMPHACRSQIFRTGLHTTPRCALPPCTWHSDCRAAHPQLRAHSPSLQSPTNMGCAVAASASEK